MPAVNASAEESYTEYLHSTFEDGADNWTGRGAAAVSAVSTESFRGSGALYTSGRTAAWNGAPFPLTVLFPPEKNTA